MNNFFFNDGGSELFFILNNRNAILSAFLTFQKVNQTLDDIKYSRFSGVIGNEDNVNSILVGAASAFVKSGYFIRLLNQIQDTSLW